MLPSHPLIAAIIPVLDNHHLTRRCVETLLAAGPAEWAPKIMIVDDGSREPYDGRNYGATAVVRNDLTRGYTQATNLGIVKVLEDFRPDAILLLNNDLEFRGNAFARLVQGLDRFDVVGPFGRFAAGADDQPTPFIEFSCVLIRTAVFARIGLLDPRFQQGYYSDDDFCVRCQIAGFRIGQLAQANPLDVVHHAGSTHGLARRERIRASYPIFMDKWGDSDHPGVRSYIRDYLWNPNIRGFGLLPQIQGQR